MRALLVLLLGIAIVVVVFRQYPSGEVDASEPAVEADAAAEAARGARGAAERAAPPVVERRKPAPAAAAEPGPDRAAAELPPMEAADPPAREPGETAGGEAGARDPEAEARAELVAPSGAAGLEVALAEALLHGGVEEVDRFLRGRGAALPAVRARLAAAYAAALFGDGARAGSLAAEVANEGGADADELRLLGVALAPPATEPTPAIAPAGAPLRRAVTMAIAERDAGELLDRRRHGRAAELLSELLLVGIDSPWDADREALARWGEKLEAAQAGHRWHPRGDWPGIEVEVEPGDSLTVIRKRVVDANPGLLVCTGLIARANRIDGYIHAGDVLRVPTDPAHCLVDLSARRAFFLFGDEVAATWEVGIGRAGEETEVGVYEVGDIQDEPMWFPEGGEPIPYGHPENPLGTHWIGWNLDGRKSGLGFHGTDEPETIGTACSDGCVRLRNEDVAVLYEIVPRGARVEVRP